MASTAPSPTRDSIKTSVVVILADSNAHLSQPKNYIDPLLKCLTEASDPPQQTYLGWVKYGPSQCSGSPSWTTPLPFVGTHNKPIALQTVPETSSGTAVLGGYAAAFQMIDDFKFQRAPKPNPKEEVSYHIWHIADGLKDEATNSPSYFGFSQTFWNLAWEAIPTEIQNRNIKLSMILLRPSPRLSALFLAVSPEKIKPWFPTCPRHEFLLSGLEPPTQLGDSIPSTVRAKRPADSDTPAEHRSQRLKVEDTSQPNTPPSLAPTEPLTTLGTPPLPYSSPPASVSRVKAPDSPTQSPTTREVKTKTDDRWSGMLYWSSGESGVCATIQATDWVRNPRPTTWPKDLRLEIIEAGIGALDIQAWILQHKAPVVRIRWTPEIGDQDFGELIRAMRVGKRVGIVRWPIETKGSPKSGLVLVPFYEALLCVAFPASDIPELPKARSPRPQPQPQQEAELQPDYAPPSNTISLEFSQRDLDLLENRTNAFATGTLTAVQPMASQQFQSQHPQAYIQLQGQLQRLQVQQDEQHPSLNPQLVLADTLAPGGGEIGAMAEHGATVYGPALPPPWYVNNTFYGGTDMSGHTSGVTLSVEDMFRTCINGYDREP